MTKCKQNSHFAYTCCFCLLLRTARNRPRGTFLPQDQNRGLNRTVFRKCFCCRPLQKGIHSLISSSECRFVRYTLHKRRFRPVFAHFFPCLFYGHGRRKWQTPRAVMANAPCRVGRHPTPFCPKRHVLTSFSLCAILTFCKHFGRFSDILSNRTLCRPRASGTPESAIFLQFFAKCI